MPAPGDDQPTVRDERVTALPGRTLPAGRYELGGALGAGGMGEVIAATDPALGRRVAFKRLHGGAATDPAQLARFLREARITAQLAHPNIVPVHELATDDQGSPYYTMKEVQGQSLADLLESEAPGPEALHRQLQVFSKVCDAIGFAHSRGVIHRDLKPANIMVGEFGEVLVLDWGLAKVVGEAESGGGGRGAGVGEANALTTQDGSVMGTPAYMPPEQAEGKVAELDARSDLYSLGAILYEILTGAPPYEGGTALQVMKQVLAGAPVPPCKRAPGRRVPWELEALVLRAMARDPQERYPDVLALKRDLEAYLGGEVLAAARYSALQRLAKWARRHRIGVAAAGVVVAAVAISFWRISRSLAAETAARREASQERDTAREEQRKFLRMSDLRRLADLVGEAEQLWPAHRRMIPAYRRWLLKADELAARLPGHRASLAGLAGPGTLDVDKQWIRDNLAQLVRGLETFTDRDSRKGLIADVRTRLDAATTSWERSVERYRDRWDAACRAIREHPAYGKLDLSPQEGLVPIGPDPDSKLWEFAHLASGAIPERDARGKLLFTEASAIVLVLLPGGAFWMGASRTGHVNRDPDALQIEGPVHRVELAPFLLGKYELTQAQWSRLTQTNPSELQPKNAPRTVRSLLHPVENVSWSEAHLAAMRAGLLLPTEAQWEYAARAGTGTVWWPGNHVRSLVRAANLADQKLRSAGWNGVVEDWLDDGHPAHAPVGLFLPNPFGLHDILGNVWEWCSDPYHERAYHLPLARDGTGGRSFPRLERQHLAERVYRGGGWDSPGKLARCAVRNSQHQAARTGNIGLRAASRLSQAP